MWWFTPDDPAKVDPPEEPKAERHCDKCGDAIWGNYFDFEGDIYCPECVKDLVLDTKKAPEWFRLVLMDVLDEYKVIV